MKIAIGSDHAGFPLKNELVPWLRKQGYDVLDVGTYSAEAVDYPDFAAAVARAVAAGETERGIAICGSGVGTSIAANKITGVRAALCHDTFSARQGVEDDAMNVLSLGGRIIGIELAKEVVTAFLGAKFSQMERHQRRLDKVLDLEKTRK